MTRAARLPTVHTQDGNFACWDLQSNETFISRKHFAGKHRSSITCGAWSGDGQILALGSKQQIKVSQPLLNASWEATAAKLALADNDLSLQELAFSPSGATLSALAGTSVFRHLCLYSVRTEESAKGELKSTLTAVTLALALALALTLTLTLAQVDAHRGRRDAPERDDRRP